MHFTIDESLQCLDGKVFLWRAGSCLIWYSPSSQPNADTMHHADRENAAAATKIGRSSRGEETGLSNDGIAFYDALAESESARTVMGEPALWVIAHECFRASGETHQSIGGTESPPVQECGFW
jgi:hypothetical protein